MINNEVKRKAIADAGAKIADSTRTIAGHIAITFCQYAELVVPEVKGKTGTITIIVQTVALTECATVNDKVKMGADAEAVVNTVDWATTIVKLTAAGTRRSTGIESPEMKDMTHTAIDANRVPGQSNYGAADELTKMYTDVTAEIVKWLIKELAVISNRLSAGSKSPGMEERTRMPTVVG